MSRTGPEENFNGVAHGVGLLAFDFNPATVPAARLVENLINENGLPMRERTLSLLVDFPIVNGLQIDRLASNGANLCC